MKNILFILLTSIVFFSCGEEKKRRGIDFETIKTDLKLTDEQALKYDAVVVEFDEIRDKQMEEMKASDKGSRKTFMKIMKASFVNQEERMNTFLSNEQSNTLHDYIKKNMPGQSDYSDELKNEIVVTLELDSIQEIKYKAVNNAFVNAFRDAHDHYHGNSEAANMYWNQFNDDRNTALKEVFTAEQYQQYLEILKKESYRGKNNKE